MTSAVSYPSQIRVLTSLRYLAAAWVALFHYALALPVVRGSPLLDAGYLGVDFFFVLSGFVLTHAYAAQVAAGRFDYWSFVSRRFARIYPMHFLMLLVFVAAGYAAGKGWIHLQADFAAVSFASIPRSELLRNFLANITLIHAWSATRYLTFNQVSWSISAEWFAYLLFPVLILIRRLPPHSEWWKLLAIVAVFLLFATAYGVLFDYPLTRLTWNAGILRIIPEFLLGMTLHKLGERWTAGRTGALAGLAGALAVTLVSILLAYRSTSAVAVPLIGLAVLGLAAVILFAADADRHDGLSILRRPLLVYLGEISYSVYMVHFAVGILIFDNAAPGFDPQSPLAALAAMLGALVVATLVSVLTYRLVEVPARRWLVRHAEQLQRPHDKGLHHAA